MTTTLDPLSPALPDPVAVDDLPRATRFFLWCAGADPRHLPTATERTRQVGFGSLVCVPPLLAGPAAAYALWRHGLPTTAWLAAALLWTVVVFTFDRFVVSTLPKTGSVTRDLLRPGFLFRLLLAGGVGLAIAHPLVLLFFEDAIAERMRLEHASRDAAIVAQSAERTAPLLTELRDLRRARALRAEELRRARALLTAEIVGEEREGMTTGRLGDGVAASARRAELQWLEQRENTERLAQDAEESRLLERIERTRAAEAAERREASIVRDDLSERSRIVSDLAREDPTVRLTRWFLVLLFVFVDTLPTLFKALTPRSLYDDLVQLEAHGILDQAKALAKVGAETRHRESAAFEDLREPHVEAARRHLGIRLGLQEPTTSSPA